MKKMKMLITLFCMMVMVFGVVSSASATPVTVTTFNSIAAGDETSQAQIDSIITNLYPSVPLPELYKAESGTLIEYGSLAGSYNTAFGIGNETAEITYAGGNIVGPIAYLLVKDGNQDADPLFAWYLYNLTALGWTGTEKITIVDIWGNNQGSISHVSLYGSNTSVPEPTTLLLLGLGLIGVAGIGRKLMK
jgi:hypothetical protein